MSEQEKLVLKIARKFSKVIQEFNQLTPNLMKPLSKKSLELMDEYNSLGRELKEEAAKIYE